MYPTGPTAGLVTNPAGRRARTGGHRPGMSESEDATPADVQPEPGGETIPADKTAAGLGDVQVGGESEEDAPTGGAAQP